MDSNELNFNELDYNISRSHKFWGRKPVSILSNILYNLNGKDIFVDPFCGSGASVLVALMKGAKVIASDINPMSIFLTKVLINPVNIPILKQKFEEIKASIRETILSTYKISCPKCGSESIIDFLVWNEKEPTHSKTKCSVCGNSLYRSLNQARKKEQLSLIYNLELDNWYPKTKISGSRKPKEKYHYELFTKRNLRNLSKLICEIEKVEPIIYKEALYYVFSAMLYSVSKMQMFSIDDPHSSRGWTALRYYMPPLNKEKNVWSTFETRFKSFIKLKEDLNKLMPDVRISDKNNYRDFLTSNDNLLLFNADIFNNTYKIPNKSTFIFLDPPYNDDIEYKSLFEFSGVWFKMKFVNRHHKPFQRTNTSIYSESISKILGSIKERTKSDIKILLAFGSVTPSIKREINKIVQKNNFIIDKAESGQFVYGIKNSIIKDAKRTDKYFFLRRKSISPSIVQFTKSNKREVEIEIARYIDLIKYLGFKSLNESKSLDKTLSKTLIALPIRLKHVFEKYIDEKRFRARLTEDLLKTDNCLKFYITFCFNLINIINIKAGLKIGYINGKYFDTGFLSAIENNCSSLIKNKKITNNCAFILENGTTSYVFNFGHQDIKVLQKMSDYIYSIDNNTYKYVHVIIFKNSEELNEARKVNKVNVYKRSFFTSFNKICSKAIEIDGESYENIFSIKWEYGKKISKQKSVVSLQNIVIIDNVRVGLEGSNLYKLTFKTQGSFDIMPGQFIMIDTLREQKDISKNYKPKVVSSIFNVIPDIHNDLKTKQITYLKRPFGIYRTYYEYFDDDYLSRLNLDKKFANILFTVKPNKFEILYKVLDGGLGTNELTKIVKNDKVEILAPLGKAFNLRHVLKEDIDEIHIIGGGVGIAPLVHLVQALRYFNLKVKAFIGIENYSSIIYTDVYEKSFTGTKLNAKIYVDDLKKLGLSETSDIFVSILDETDEKQEIDIKNVFKGSFITEPYSNYLKNCTRLKVLTFTCGPLPMMHKVHELTTLYNVKSYVLMEKRMACGTGVCFSCVCKTKVNNEDQYTRICIDGPIIESKIINWDEK